MASKKKKKAAFKPTIVWAFTGAEHALARLLAPSAITLRVLTVASAQNIATDSWNEQERVFQKQKIK